MSLNKVILVGRLTRDPELRYTPAGKPVATFSIAVDRPVAAKNGEKETDYVDIVAWQNTAEVVAKYAVKGSLVGVDGRLQVRQYEKDGQKRRAYEVVAADVRLLGSRPSGQGGSEGGYSSREGGSSYGRESSAGYGSYESAPSTQHSYDSGANNMGVDDIPF
jgi:single-strand DNA-binding protein